MALINAKAGQTALLRVRILEDASALNSVLVPVLVEQTVAFGGGAYIGKVLAPFTELVDPWDDAGIARLRQPREIDPTTAKR